MIALDRILVPHDFTEPAAAALHHARALADIFEAGCEVLHVVERAGTDVGGERPAGLAMTFRDGVPDEEIARYARDRAVDLIVMGTHGRRGPVHALLGSVAEKVVRTAPCPVLTVRRRMATVVPANVLVATDFGIASGVALEYGRTLARLFNAPLHLLHVVDNYFMRPVVHDPHCLVAAARAQVEAQLTHDDRAGLCAHAVLEMSDSPADAIVGHATNADIGLIVMGTHGRRRVERILLGSVAERVIRIAPCPVLAVHHPERDFVTVGAANRVAGSGVPEHLVAQS